MVKSKFLDIVRTFSKEELKEFRGFIASPVYNTNKNVIKIYDIVRKQKPGFNSPVLEKEELFKVIYPGKKYNDTVMRILSSDLLSLSEEFITFKRFSEYSFDKSKYLLEELKDRNLGSLFVKHQKEAGNILNNCGISIQDFYLNHYHLESSNVDFLIRRDRQDESGKNLLRKSEYLVTFALTNILNIVQELSEHEEVLNERSEFSLALEFLNSLDLDRIMKYMKERKFEHYAVIEIYYLMYKCMLGKKYGEEYIRLKELIGKNMELFSREEQYNLFLILESCCLTQMRYGNLNDYNELLNVYELMLGREIFSVSSRDYMQANLYRNIFYTAVVLGKFEWAEKFTSDYSAYLLPGQKEDMIHYTSSILKFERKEFEDALEEITKVNYGFFVFKFDARLVMMKIYYEMKAFDPVLSLVDTFTHFLAKNKIVSEIYKEQFMNFLKFLKMLIKLSQSSPAAGKIDVHELTGKIKSTHVLINKRWLLDKAREMIKK